MSYFRNFPNIEVPINGNPVSVKDIIRRVKLSDDIFENESNYNYYRLSDGETLKDVARKQYGDPSLDWAIILFNGLTDPFYSTPLTTNEFEDFVESKYSGQSLFCSAGGSSLPYFLNEGSFDVGDFVAEKTFGQNNERIFSDNTKRATVKSLDSSLSKIQLTEQIGSFEKGDLLANRTQFVYNSNATINREETLDNNQTYVIPTGSKTFTTRTLWQPSDNGNGTLTAHYTPDNIGGTLVSGLSGAGGSTINRVNLWKNSTITRNIDLSCVTADFMPILGSNGYNGNQYVECNLSSIFTGNTQGSRMSFANNLGDFGIGQQDFMVFMMMQFKNANSDLGGILSIPSRSRFSTGSATRSGYENRFISGLLGSSEDGPVISQRFHSLQTNPVDKHCPITRVPPRVRPNAKPNIICFGRSGGGTGNGKPFFRINGKPAVVAGNAGNLTTISFVDLTKVDEGDNVDFFSLTETNAVQFSPFEGQVYEMVIYRGFTGPDSDVLDIAQRTEGYLAHKYDKQNEVLSPLHEYRTSPPTVGVPTLASGGVEQNSSNNEIGINPGADGDERTIRVDKVVSGPDAVRRFILDPGSTTEFVLNPLASPPDSNNQQTPIGMTSSSFDSGLTAVTYGSTILYNYLYNDDATYVQTNKMYEEKLNEEKRIIRLPRREFIPVLVQTFQRAISS